MTSVALSGRQAVVAFGVEPAPASIRRKKQEERAWRQDRTRRPSRPLPLSRAALP